MTTNGQPPDDWDDAQLTRLLEPSCEAPVMRADFVDSLSQRLDAEYAAIAPALRDGERLDERINGNGYLPTVGNRTDVATSSTNTVRPLSPLRRRRWRVAAGVAVAASLMAALAAWNDRPAYGWAAMVDALDRSEWVQAVASEGEGKTRGWYSPATGNVAVRTEQLAIFADRRRQMTSSYRTEEQQVYQSASAVRKPLSWDTELVRMLLAAASKAPEGELSKLDDWSRLEVQSESWRRIERDGRALIELRVVLRLESNDAAPARLVSMSLLLNPATKLPVECHLLDSKGRPTKSFKLEYPERGPDSIYSLGVPETVPLVNVSIQPARSSLSKREFVGAPEAVEKPPQLAALSLADAASIGKPDEPAWSPLEQPLPTEELVRQVDEQLAAVWQAQAIHPAAPASDIEFMRRIYLDLTGRIPSVSEVRRFKENGAVDRRQQLIEEILAQRDHATHLAAVWRRILLPDDVDLSPYGGGEKFEEWLAERFAANVPYSELVRDLLLAEGRISESGPLVFYAALKLNPEELAARTSRAFMGVRMECAQCHDHKFDDVTQQDFWSFAAFFARISRPQGKMEMTSPVLRVHDSQFGDVKIPESDVVVAPELPMTGVKAVDAPDGPSRREQLVAWLTAPNNGHFARAVVNRAWAHMFGRGLVEPVDDMRPANVPIAPEVLDLLSRDFAAGGFDLRRLFRVLASTQAYQLSSRSDVDDPSRALHFAQMNIKTFTAEQLYDCIAVAAQRSVAEVPSSGPPSLLRYEDSSRQAFIEQFRAPPGDAVDYHAGIPQALTLMHGGLIHQVTDLSTGGLLRSLSAPFFTNEQRLDALFIATLSRHPSDNEQRLMLEELQGASDDAERQQVLGDLLWALLNSAEFTFNH